MRVIKPSFTTGEVSPKLWERVDLEKFATSCKELQNFIVMPYGGVNRRPGFEYLGEVGDDTYPVRLIPFNYSTTTAFIIEMGHQYLRFWSNGELVLSGGNPLEITSPWTYDQIFEVQYVQINDVVYLVHPDVVPQRLVRVADDNWTIAEPSWTAPPVEDVNTTTTTLTPSATSGTGITVTASASVFIDDHVGGYIQFSHVREDPSVSRVLTASGNSSALRVTGGFRMDSYGSWGPGTLFLEEYRNETWVTLQSWVSTANNQRNVSYVGDAPYNTPLRVRYSGSGDAGSIAILTADDPIDYGYVKITSRTSGTVVVGDVVLDDLNSTDATNLWALSVWRPDTGYPRTVGVHEQRLVYGGTKTMPITLWGSEIGNFDHFRIGTNPSDSFVFTLASTERHLINWLSSQSDVLVVGTSAEEWLIKAREEGTALGPPGNIKANRESRFGSKYLQAWVANDRLMFAQRLGRKLREFAYSFSSDSWESTDVTLLSEHITTQQGITQVAFEQQPDGIVWTSTVPGTLSGMTYERLQQVYGWHRHTTKGIIESVAVIYGPQGDEVWATIQRTINGSTKRYVERMDTDYLDVLENEQKDRWFYVDSGLRVDLGAGNESMTLDGLDHLEGETVQILADGAVFPNEIVTGGSVSISIPAQVWVVGIGYESILRPVGIELAMQDGTSQGRKFKVHELVVRIYKSLGGEYESQPDQWFYFPIRDTSDVMDDSPPVFTGPKTLTVAGSYTDTAEMAVRQRQPLPLTVLAIIPKFNVYGH